MHGINSSQLDEAWGAEIILFYFWFGRWKRFLGEDYLSVFGFELVPVRFVKIVHAVTTLATLKTMTSSA